jgi:hypothetical protein
VIVDADLAAAEQGALPRGHPNHDIEQVFASATGALAAEQRGAPYGIRSAARVRALA